jgi:LysM domain-containing protein
MAPAAAQTARPAPAPTTVYATVALSQATVARTTFYVTPPASLLTSTGVPFTLGNAYWLHSGEQPASLTMNYDKPVAVYLLINTSWTDAAFAGKTVGTVHLTYSDGTSRDTALVVGANIREWEYGVSWTANTLSSSSTASVWQGQGQAAQGGAMGTIDMLTISAIPTSPAAHLTGVTVSDTYAAHMGIVFQGLTVLYDPVLPRPGESDDTPAVVHSRAPEHSNSQNFTGIKPAKDAAPRGHRHGIYVVVSGDTLWGIATKEGVSLPALIKENPQIKNKNLIRVGQPIRIP